MCTTSPAVADLFRCIESIEVSSNRPCFLCKYRVSSLISRTTKFPTATPWHWAVQQANHPTTHVATPVLYVRCLPITPTPLQRRREEARSHGTASPAAGEEGRRGKRPSQAADKALRERYYAVLQRKDGSSTLSERIKTLRRMVLAQGVWCVQQCRSVFLACASVWLLFFWGWRLLHFALCRGGRGGGCCCLSAVHGRRSPWCRTVARTIGIIL